MPRSIRWRLPLQYAGIALLAALLLGLVLLIAVRGYYIKRESDYLTRNASAIGSQISAMLEADASEGLLDAHVEALSLLSQTRVKIFDTRNAVLADSGEPGSLSGLAKMSLDLSLGGVSHGFSQTLEGAEGQEQYASTVSIEGTEIGPSGETIRESLLAKSGGRAASGGAPASGEELVPLTPALAPELDFGLWLASSTDIPRSSRSVTLPVHDVFGRLQGHVELSNGPAFGRGVLRSVAAGWAVAAAVAVAVAAGVGWLMSLRITGPLSSLAQVTARMAEGNLSGRADVRRDDELGQLATSFNQMAERVEDTVSALRRFVADAAHQLLTPLTALRTNLDVADSARDAQDLRTLVQNARVQLDRLEGMCVSLLDLSRLEAAPAGSRHAQVPLDTLISEVSEPFASRAEQAGIVFSLGPPPDSAVVRGNEDQ